MNRRSLIRAMAVVLCSAVSMQAQVSATHAPADASNIMKEVYRQDTSHDISMRASFQIFDAQGHSTRKEFTYRRLGSPGDSKTLVVFTAPPEIRGVALLSINQHAASVRQY